MEVYNGIKRGGSFHLCPPRATRLRRALVISSMFDRKEYQKQYQKRWRKQNPEKAKEIDRKQTIKHKEKRKQALRLWRLKNPEARKRYWLKEKQNPLYKRKRNENRNKKYKVDIKFKLDTLMGTMLYKVLRNKKSGKSWEKLVGYTLENLIKHLENQFDKNMSWRNYGSYWHIDHIIPKSLFKYENAENSQFKECWALENLQPLERITNMKKGNKSFKDN